MPTLFKYLPSKFLDAFVGQGEILFRSLSYFRNYEEIKVRGDRHEGRRLYQPPQGLEITKVDTGEKSLLPWAFESCVKDREIFVFCLSTKFSEGLAQEFGADACVSIHDPVALIARIRAALSLRRWVKHGCLLHQPVDYYSPSEAPFAEWAVPERMVMRKTTEYSYQNEYRLAFARGNALQVNNVDALITSTPGSSEPTLSGHPEHKLRVGSLARICTVRTFA